jgi:hypothetical protein
MPNIITGHNDVLIVLGATNGGWCIYAGNPDNTATEILETSPAAALSDDEGLIEWFADQLALPTPKLQARPPNPEPEAKPAEHGAPPVAAPAPGQFEDALQLSVIREALAPFANCLRLEPQIPDTRIIWNALRGEPYGYAEVTVGQLRDLLRAAGMFTDEMQAPAQDTGPATAAGDKPPSPAATDPAEVDQLEVLDVGAADDDEGLF